MRGPQRWIMLFGLVGSLALGCGRLPLGSGVRATATSGADVADGATDDTPAAGLVAPTPLATPDAEMLAQQLRSANGQQRLAAAWSLPDRSDIPVRARVDLLVEGLDHEIREPAQGPSPTGSYLPPSSFARLHLTRALSELGSGAISALREAADGASGEAREHILVALVYAGDRDVIPQVRELVTQASSPAVRMDAARALGQAEDRDAFMQLEAALQDSYVVTGEDDLGAYTLHPVREQAAAALRALGVTVERLGDGAFEIGE